MVPSSIIWLCVCATKVQGIHMSDGNIKHMWGLCLWSLQVYINCNALTLHSTVHGMLQKSFHLYAYKLTNVVYNYARWLGSTKESCSEHAWETGQRQQIPKHSHILWWSCILLFKKGKEMKYSHWQVRTPLHYSGNN